LCHVAMRKCKRRGVFSRGDHSPRQAKTRQTIGENATRGMSRTFLWRGERSSCENTKKSPFGGFLHGAFSRFRPENTIIRHDTNQPPYTRVRAVGEEKSRGILGVNRYVQNFVSKLKYRNKEKPSKHPFLRCFKFKPHDLI